jgi:hypothetical protein
LVPAGNKGWTPVIDKVELAEPMRILQDKKKEIAFFETEGEYDVFTPKANARLIAAFVRLSRLERGARVVDLGRGSVTENERPVLGWEVCEVFQREGFRTQIAEVRRVPSRRTQRLLPIDKTVFNLPFMKPFRAFVLVSGGKLSW